MTDTQKRLTCQLSQLVQLAHKAQVAVSCGDYRVATDILHGNITSLVQQAAHEAWLHYHRSGTPD